MKLFRGLFFLLAVFVLLPAVCAAESSVVRPAAVAGKFYPEDPSRLSAVVDTLMRQATAPEMEVPVALVVPHAGYAYSGQICADAFKLASRSSFDRIIVLGTNHTDSDFQGISVFDAGEFETPLGRIPVDE